MLNYDLSRRRFVQGAGLTSIAALLAACGGGNAPAPEGGEEAEGGEAAPASAGNDLVIALNYEPDTMNIYATHLLGDVQAMVVEGLLVPNGDMVYVPRLAKEVPTVENCLITMKDDGTMDITYNLREGLKWHDGEPVTSADVKITWETVSASEWESTDGCYDIDSIDCPDDLTVVCHYNKQTPDFAQRLFTFGIMPKHIIKNLDMADETNEYDNAPVGTGPYKFVEWKRGEYIRLEKNEDYWGEGPYMDSVTFRFIEDENTRINMLKTGEIGFTAGISYGNYDQVKDLPGMQCITHGLNSWRYLDFNCTKPGLDDVAVRRAISCAIDKQALVDQLFAGLPTPCDRPWMPSDPYHVEGFTSQWSYDPAKAEQILEEAGWVKGADDVREKDGVRLEFIVGCAQGRQEMESMQQVIIDDLKKVGIKVTAETYAASAWSSMMWDGEYELGLGGYITSPGASHTLFWASDPELGYLNRGKWFNPAFDEPSYKLDSEMNEETRKALVKERLAAFDDTLPQVILYASTEIISATDRLQGFEPNPTNMTNFCMSAPWKLA